MMRCAPARRVTDGGGGSVMATFSVEPNDAIGFRVAHEDADVAVVEKPARLATQPGKGHVNDTLLNGLFARWGARLQALGRSRDFGLLHRLDRDTSGLLAVALSARAYDALRSAFAGREVRKFYWAVTVRAPSKGSGVVRLPIAEVPPTRDRPKLARIGRSGKNAITAYRVLDVSPAGALVEARPVTGRLHQVRVHLNAIGCPILGDKFYAPDAVAAASGRLALHAHRLAFAHPVTGESVDIGTGWPGDLRRLLKRLRLRRPDLAVDDGAVDSGAVEGGVEGDG